MKLLSDKSIRAVVAKCLRHLARELKTEQSLTLRELDGLASLISENQKISSGRFKELFQHERTLVVLQCLALAQLCFCLDTDRKSRRWKKAGALGNSFIRNGILVNVVNHSLATVELMDSGFDNSARIMLRAVYEACWTASVLFADDELMKIFCSSGADEEKQLKTWHKHFKPSRLRIKLSEIDRQLGFDESAVKELDAERKETYSYFSNSAHHSPLATLLGQFSGSVDDSERMEFALFGKVAAASRSHLRSMSYALMQLTLLLHYKIKKDGLAAKTKSWRDTQHLIYAALAAYGKFILAPATPKDTQRDT